MFEETIEKLGGLDILINNAGIQKSGDSETVSLDDVESVLKVNLKGAFDCARIHRSQDPSQRRRPRSNRYPNQ